MSIMITMALSVLCAPDPDPRVAEIVADLRAKMVVERDRLIRVETAKVAELEAEIKKRRDENAKELAKLFSLKPEEVRTAPSYKLPNYKLRDRNKKIIATLEARIVTTKKIIDLFRKNGPILWHPPIDPHRQGSTGAVPLTATIYQVMPDGVIGWADGKRFWLDHADTSGLVDDQPFLPGVGGGIFIVEGTKTLGDAKIARIRRLPIKYEQLKPNPLPSLVPAKAKPVAKGKAKRKPVTKRKPVASGRRRAAIKLAAAKALEKRDPARAAKLRKEAAKLVRDAGKTDR